MNKHKLKHRFFLIVFLSGVLNSLIFFIWISLRFSPIIPQLQFIKNKAIINEIDNKYLNEKKFYYDLNEFEKNHDIFIEIKSSNNECIRCSDERNHFFIDTKLVIVENNIYELKIYGKTNLNMGNAIFKLILFQIFVSFIIYVLIYLFSRNLILAPLETLISNIRNYKFGKKPKKTNINTEFDLINNEFLDLTYSIEKEKQEQNRIIASIAHDIKTPLTTIIGYSDLLSEQNLDKDSKLYNKKINEKAKHIKDLLNSFDDYLVNELNSELEIKEFTIEEITNYLNDDFKLELENKNIKLNITTKLKKEIIYVDIIKFKRIFANIISNSVRYVKNPGKINIYINKNDKDYIFKIKDNGPGASEEIINDIFNLLYTTDYSRKLSGLGLSICKEFVEKHNGKIKAYNEKGFVIEFTIPIDKVTE